MARLYYYYGVMGSAKTARALITAFNFKEKGKKVQLAKPAIDTRSSTISSRIGLSSPCDLIEKDQSIFSIIKEPIDWLIIDECQFLTLEQVDNLITLVDDNEINVMCFGLKTNFKGELFSASKRLIEMADVIREIKSMCHCGNKATFNARVINDEIMLEGPEILIGGNETYIALCRKCWMNGDIG